jgi:hypothetical protein
MDQKSELVTLMQKFALAIVANYQTLDEAERAAERLTDATCNAFSFLPANVPDGIVGPTDDPIFAVRSPAYVVSLIRRKAP